MLNLLNRRLANGLSSYSPQTFTSSHIKVDGFLSNFCHELRDWRNLAAMTIGGFAYRLGRVGMLGVSSVTAIDRIAAPMIGLACKVTISRQASFFLKGEACSPVGKEYWLRDYLSFGSLKLFGRISYFQSLLFSHFIQNKGMALDRQIAYGLHLATFPNAAFLRTNPRSEAVYFNFGRRALLLH